MTKGFHFGPWMIVVAVLLALAAFFRFALRGYSYIAYTLCLIVVMILLRRFAPVWLWRISAVAVCIGLIYFAAVEFLIVRDSFTSRNAERKYVIVLGAEVQGTRPSRSLLYRLNAAMEYLWAYSDSVAIVSGGQGEGEDMTEAQCMRDWLVAKGVAPERIIMEDKATSTMENLEFSFEKIRENGDEPDGNVTIISSSYHLYRAKQMAKKLGVDAAGYACSPGNPVLALNFFIREAFGVTHLWVFGE